MAIPKQICSARARILSYLLKLNKCIDAQHADLVQAIAQRLNEVLVDYISYGHFRLLQDLVPEAHQMAAIDKTSQTVLAFSEKYTTCDPINLRSLKQDLEQLAYSLEVRFEIEDEIAAELAVTA
jgi:regulator of sigma D